MRIDFTWDPGNIEERWFTLGLAFNGRLLAVSHTHANGDESSEVRLISARSATRAQRRQYENEPS